jgi:heavy metal translocating P-type ATPase
MNDTLEHDPDAITCCSHHEIEIDRYIVLYLAGLVLVVTTFIADSLNLVDGQIVQIPALLGALLLGGPLFLAAIKEILTGKLSASTLTALAIIAAIATGKYVTAGALAFILLVADQIVRRTAFGAQRAIEQLVRLTPDTARILEKDKEREVSLSQVTVDMTVRVRPGENFPVDGEVVSGRSTVNQASLTGEALPVEVEPGSPVYAGTTNQTGVIDLRVTQVGEDTTIGKVSQLIREAEQSRSPRQLLIQQVAQFYVPVALSVAAIVWFIMSQSPDPVVKSSAAMKAVSVLVVTCPSSLLLAYPSAMVAAFASAARLGIMIKETTYLEEAAQVDTIVLDKTGTITTGQFAVSKLVPAPAVEGAELLAAAANGDQHSNHPLAKSILATASAARIETDGSKDYEEIHGRGVRAHTKLGELCVGRASWLLELKPEIADELAEVESKIEGMTGVHVMRDGKYLGAVGLEDKVRANTRGVIERLRELGARHITIFTGDRLSVARRVGQAVGVDSIEAECHPEEKHEQIRAMVQAGRHTLMVGDGINDGPSLAAADVGVAMGLSGSDIATNSAGIALMNDDLSRIPFLIELSRKTRAIIAQNITASIIIAILGLTLAASGALAVWAAALYHFTADVFVIGNSFRLFRFGEQFTEAETPATPTIPRREASVHGLAAQPT